MKNIFKLFAGIALALPAFAASQGLNTGSTTNVSIAIPNTAAYTAIGNFRVEWRDHGCSGNPGHIWLSSWFSVTYTACNQVSIYVGSTGLEMSFPAAWTDRIFRVQIVNGLITFEIWNLADGSYRSATGSYSATFSPAGETDTLPGVDPAATIVDYFRWYSTTVATGGNPDSDTGDLLDLEFDGTIADSGAHSLATTFTGAAPSYSNTPIYPPFAALAPFASGCFTSSTSSPNWCVIATGTTVKLVSASYDLNGLALSYSWTQTAGPAAATISNPAASSTTITGMTSFGEYDFQLTITNSNNVSASVTQRLGAVSVSAGNGNCLISDVPPNMQYLIGPLTQWGSSCDPWPWYDIAEVGDANVLMATYSKPPTGDAPAAGTISFQLNNGVYQIAGSGTAFTTLPHSCDGTGCPSAGGNGGDYGIYLSLWWNAEGGTGTGRFIIQIPPSGILSDTLLSPSLNFFPPGVAVGSGSYRYSLVNAPDYWVPFSLISQPSYSWNYYDNVIAFYRLYYRTGITAYLTQARKLADDWWVYALDHGYSPSAFAPRSMGLPGEMARAIDGGFSARWAGLENLVGRNLSITTVAPGGTDVREAGYASSYLGLLAALDPNIAASSSLKAQYCGYLASNVNTFWTPLLSTTAGYGQNSFIINQSYPNYGNEVEPWQLAITATGFRDAYRAASGICADPATAANANSLLSRTLDFMYSYGALGTRTIPAANGGGTGRIGMAYFIGAQATGEIPYEPCTGAAAQALLPCIGGTVSGTSGSTLLLGDSFTFTGTLTSGSPTISGVSPLTGLGKGAKLSGSGVPPGTLISSLNASTGVLTMSAAATAASGSQSLTESTNFVSGGVFKCNGTDFVGIWTESPPTVHRIASCADDTHMTLAASDPLVSNVASSLFAESYVDGANDCSPSRSKYCFGGTDPDNSTDNAGIFGWYYAFTGNHQWLTWGDDLFSSWAGGPAGGPGASGPPAGPGSSGQTTSPYGYITALSPCATSSIPCGGPTPSGAVPIHWGKDFGIGSGWAGAADNYFAYRILAASILCAAK